MPVTWRVQPRGRAPRLRAAGGWVTVGAMKILSTFAFVVVATVAACGGKSKPAAPPAPDPTAACHLDGPSGTPSTAEQCECAGHLVVGDIGDGKVACPDGATEISRINYGIEGGVCCDQGEPAASASAAP